MPPDIVRRQTSHIIKPNEYTSARRNDSKQFKFMLKMIKSHKFPQNIPINEIIKIKNQLNYLKSRISGAIYRLVPTRGFEPASNCSFGFCITAKPKSAITHVPFSRTKIFFDFKSR